MEFREITPREANVVEFVIELCGVASHDVCHVLFQIYIFYETISRGEKRPLCPLAFLGRQRANLCSVDIGCGINILFQQVFEPEDIAYRSVGADGKFLCFHMKRPCFAVCQCAVFHSVGFPFPDQDEIALRAVGIDISDGGRQIVVLRSLWPGVYDGGFSQGAESCVFLRDFPLFLLAVGGIESQFLFGLVRPPLGQPCFGQGQVDIAQEVFVLFQAFGFQQQTDFCWKVVHIFCQFGPHVILVAQLFHESFFILLYGFLFVTAPGVQHGHLASVPVA